MQAVAAREAREWEDHICSMMQTAQLIGLPAVTDLPGVATDQAGSPACTPTGGQPVSEDMTFVRHPSPTCEDLVARQIPSMHDANAGPTAPPTQSLPAHDCFDSPRGRACTSADDAPSPGSCETAPAQLSAVSISSSSHT